MREFNLTVVKVGLFCLCRVFNMDEFFLELDRLIKDSNRDSTLDYIFEYVDSLLESNDLESVRKILLEIDVTKYCEYILISLFTVTYPFKSSLGVARVNYLSSIQSELKSRNVKDYEKMIGGLE